VKRLSRLIKILHTLGKYRLIDLLPAQRPFIVRCLFLPFYLYPKKTRYTRAQRLRMALEELGPIFVKFGQILSTRPDLFPPDIIEELTLLQDNVAPFDNSVFKNIIETTLEKSVDELFESYENAPIASASIAQVHGVTLTNGERAVIKVVRPGIENIIELDTALLGVLANWVERLSAHGRRMRPIEVVRDYRETIFDELDLIREGANASQLRRNFEDSSQLYIPKVYWEYTRRNVLVMERIHGIPVNDLERIRGQNTNLKMLAETGVEIFFTQVFDHNFFHADMHPGNVFVSEENPQSPSYIAIDMAIVGSLTREDQYYLARNLIAMFRRNYREVAELHVLSGWVPEGTSVSSFESAIRSVCEPIFQKPLKEISFGEALITLFRTAQRFDMPVQPQLVLLQKTLLNIEGLGRQIYPELDLWETAHPYLEKWIKKRYHPKTVFDELKYHSTDWIEKFPQVPGLVFDTISQIKTVAELAPELKTASKAISDRRSKKPWYKKVLASLLLVSAAVTFSVAPELISVSNTLAALALAAAALVTLL